MADKKITDLVELTTGQIASADLVFVYDADAGVLKAAQLAVIDEGFTTAFTRTLLDDADAATFIATLFASGKPLYADTTAGRILRVAELRIHDATDATEIQCQLISLWNGDDDGPTDNIGKSETVGNYTLSSTGSDLYIESGAITGDPVAVVSATIYRNQSTTDITVRGIVSTTKIRLTFYDTATGAAADLTSLVDTATPIFLQIAYITDA